MSERGELLIQNVWAQVGNHLEPSVAIDLCGRLTVALRELDELREESERWYIGGDAFERYPRKEVTRRRKAAADALDKIQSSRNGLTPEDWAKALWLAFEGPRKNKDWAYLEWLADKYAKERLGWGPVLGPQVRPDCPGA